MIQIDEDAESWATLMMFRDAAKANPALRREFVEGLAPEVVRAADECTGYEDFKHLLTQRDGSMSADGATQTKGR